MMLTEKAKQDFEKWLEDTDNIYGLDLFQLSNICINALIIEWFDSVGIYIGLVRFNVGSGYFEARIHYQGGIYFTSISRLEATEKGIIKANEIYNNIK